MSMSESKEEFVDRIVEGLLKIGCPEEVAIKRANKKWSRQRQLQRSAAYDRKQRWHSKQQGKWEALGG